MIIRHGKKCRTRTRIGPSTEHQNDRMGSLQVKRLKRERKRQSQAWAISTMGCTIIPSLAIHGLPCEYLPAPNKRLFSSITKCALRISLVLPPLAVETLAAESDDRFDE